jgi:hypothetical protein
MRTSVVHHVVVEEAGGVGGELEGLVGAGGSDDGVGRGDGRYDVLDHTLRAAQRHPLDPEFLKFFTVIINFLIIILDAK